MERTVLEAARVMAGEVVAGAGDRAFSGAALDSRRVEGGELFFALPGEKTDGHRFAGQALERGAAAAVVSRSWLAEHPEEAAAWPAAGAATGAPKGALVAVEDPYRALHDLTRAVRREVPRHLVGITGSAGKTTTKELLAAMLAARFRVAKSPGNLNNLLGFPLALLAVPADTEWMVAEMGMSEPGELGGVATLAKPEVAVFTNVRHAHLERFGTLRAIAAAKAELLEGLTPDGLVVANADDPEVRWIAGKHPGRILFYGRRENAAQSGAEVTAGEITTGEITTDRVEGLGPGPGSRFTLEAGGERVRVELPLYGLYNVDNCLAAAACAHALGVGLDGIASAVAGVRAPEGRGQVHTTPGGAVLVDDSYNSNPEALSQALESAAAASGDAARRWAVLGDMLELGPRAPEFHREAGADAAARGFSPVVAVGELAREIEGGARRAGAETHWFASAAEAAAWLDGRPAAGELVLVKGSRGVGLDAVVSRLLGEERA